MNIEMPNIAVSIQDLHCKRECSILSTSIKLPFVIKIFVLSILSGRFTQVLLHTLLICYVFLTFTHASRGVSHFCSCLSEYYQNGVRYWVSRVWERSPQVVHVTRWCLFKPWLLWMCATRGPRRANQVYNIKVWP